MHKLRNGLCIIRECFVQNDTLVCSPGFWSHGVMCVCISCVRQLVLRCMLNVAFTFNVIGVKALDPASGEALSGLDMLTSGAMPSHSIPSNPDL